MTSKTSVVADPASPTILITRLFDAPPHLVWRTLTEPELVKQWAAHCTMEWITCDLDVRPGGAWRELLRMNGQDHGFRGEYREVVPYERLIRTRIYDPYPDAEALETVTLTEVDAQTKLQVTLRHKTMEARDHHLRAGMDEGVRVTHAQLEALLATLKR